MIRLLLSLLWLLLGVFAFLSLARVFLWALSWYFIRAALAIGLAYFVIDRVRRLRQIQHLRAMTCLLYTSPSPRDLSTSRMPSSA